MAAGPARMHTAQARAVNEREMQARRRPWCSGLALGGCGGFAGIGGLGGVGGVEPRWPRPYRWRGWSAATDGSNGAATDGSNGAATDGSNGADRAGLVDAVPILVGVEGVIKARLLGG